MRLIVSRKLIEGASVVTAVELHPAAREMYHRQRGIENLSDCKVPLRLGPLAGNPFELTPAKKQLSISAIHRNLAGNAGNLLMYPFVRAQNRVSGREQTYERRCTERFPLRSSRGAHRWIRLRNGGVVAMARFE